MFLKTYNFIIILLLGAGSFGAIQTALAQAPSTPVNTFSDPTSGISLKYPLDWTVASKDFTNAFFGKSGAANPSSENGAPDNSPSPSLSTTAPIVMLLPQSLDGANIVILSEILPFPITVDKYIEITKSHLTTFPISSAIPFSIANSNGLKYTLQLPSGVTQTQIAFVKGSKAFITGYNLGQVNQAKDAADINSIISSIAYQNGQGLTSQSSTNSGNIGTGVTNSSSPTLPNSPTSNALASTSSNGVSTSSGNNATVVNVPNSGIQPNLGSSTSNSTTSASTR